MSDQTVRVPVEPTEEMCNAGCRSLASGGLPVMTFDALDCYKAMLAAAPTYYDARHFENTGTMHVVCKCPECLANRTAAPAEQANNTELVKRLRDWSKPIGNTIECYSMDLIKPMEKLLDEAAAALEKRTAAQQEDRPSHSDGQVGAETIATSLPPVAAAATGKEEVMTAHPTPPLTDEQIDEWDRKIQNKIWSEFAGESNEAHGKKLMAEFARLCAQAKTSQRPAECAGLPNRKDYGGVCDLVPRGDYIDALRTAAESIIAARNAEIAWLKQENQSSAEDCAEFARQAESAEARVKVLEAALKNSDRRLDGDGQRCWCNNVEPDTVSIAHSPHCEEVRLLLKETKRKTDEFDAAREALKGEP